MIISRFFHTVVKEEFFDSIFGEQRAAKDAHDLHDRAVEFEVMFDDADEAVGDDCHMDLDAHGVLGFSPECLDSKVLLDPFEEELHLPSISIQKRNVLGREVEVVGVVGKCPLQLRSIVDDSSKFRRIVLSIILSREADCLVSDDVVISFEEVLTSDDLVFRMTLFTDDEKGSGLLDDEESCKVKVSSIKHIAGRRLVCEPVHGVDIVGVSISDSVENGYLGDDVNLGMDPNAGLCRPKLRPTEYRQAKVDGCGVDGIESSVQLKLSDDTFLLGNPHHVECKLFKDAIVSDRVCLRKQASIDGRFPKTEMIRLLSMCDYDIGKFSQTATSKKLAKHQDKEMCPMGGCPIMSTIIILLDESFKVSLWQEFYDLTKNILSCVHISEVDDNDANIRISNRRQYFSYLNNCA